MKKVVSYLIMLALMAGVLGAILSTNARNDEETGVVCSILEFISPAVVYADTVGEVKPPPPPPID